MKKVTALLICIAIALTFVASCSEAEQPLSVAELLEVAERYLLEGNYEQALVEFMRVIEIDPREPRGYTGAADALIGLGRYDEAIDILQQGLRVLPGNAEIQMLLDSLKSTTEVTELESQDGLIYDLYSEQELSDVTLSEPETFSDFARIFYQFIQDNYAFRDDFLCAEMVFDGQNEAFLFVSLNDVLVIYSSIDGVNIIEYFVRERYLYNGTLIQGQSFAFLGIYDNEIYLKHYDRSWSYGFRYRQVLMTKFNCYGIRTISILICHRGLDDQVGYYYRGSRSEISYEEANTLIESIIDNRVSTFFWFYGGSPPHWGENTGGERLRAYFD